MTMKYLHVDFDELAEAVATIPALPGTAPEPTLPLPGMDEADHGAAKTNPDQIQPHPAASQNATTQNDKDTPFSSTSL